MGAERKSLQGRVGKIRLLKLLLDGYGLDHHAACSFLIVMEVLLQARQDLRRQESLPLQLGDPVQKVQR